MAIGYLKLRQGGATIDIPVVNLGASPLASKLRAKVPAGIGELPLVYPDDNRASGLRVRQAGVTLAIAKDERVSITHPDDVSVSHSHKNEGRLTTRTVSKYLGSTFFNRTTRIEAGFSSVGANAWCDRWDPWSSPWHGTRATARLKVSNAAATYYTGGVSVSVGGNHPLASSWWQTGWGYASGAVAVDVSPGRYDIHLELTVEALGEVTHWFHSEGSATLDYWTEIARG